MLSDIRKWAISHFEDSSHGSTWSIDVKIKIAFLLVLIHVAERWKILNGLD